MRWVVAHASPVKLVSTRLGRRRRQEAIRADGRSCTSREAICGARGSGRPIAQEPSLGRPAPVRAAPAQGRSAYRRWLLVEAGAVVRAPVIGGGGLRLRRGVVHAIGCKLAGVRGGL